MGCTLCPGGNDLLPDPEREIIRFVTCGGIAKVVERFAESQCTAYQKIIGDFCGCPDAPVDEVCRICGGDQFVDFPAAFVDLSEIGLDRVPCAFYETISNDPEFAEGFSCAALRLDAPDCCTVPTEPLVPPDNLAELCTAALVGSSVDAYLECATTCSGGFCCGLEGPSSCFLEFAETCGAYTPCDILDVVDFPEGNGPLEPPEDLATTCDAELIGSSLEAFVACARVCLGGACCEGPCLSTEFFATCAAYASCANLELVEFPQGGPLDPPDDLANLCNVDLIASSEEASLECATACIGGACCEGACFTDSFETCVAYAPCANLAGVSSPVAPSPVEEPTLTPAAAPTMGPIASTPEPTASPVAAPTKAPTPPIPDPEAGGMMGMSKKGGMGGMMMGSSKSKKRSLATTYTTANKRRIYRGT